MPINESPGVFSKEIDLTFRTQSIGGNNAAMVGAFQWGAVDKPVLITGGEEELVSKYLSPDDETAVSFLSAANYLLYSNSLYVTRIVGAAAKNSVPTTKIAVLVKNSDHYDTLTLTGLTFVGRYAGSLLNGATLEIMGITGYSGWAYKDQFTYAPVGALEFNAVLIDTTGTVTGTAGAVIEKFELLNKTTGTKKFDGTSAYYKDVINNSSNFLRVGDIAEVLDVANGVTVVFANGVDDNTKANIDYVSGFDLYANPEEHSIRFAFAGDSDVVGIQQLIDNTETRKDGIAFFSPELADVVNAASPQDNSVDMREVQVNKNTSYAVMDCNWKLVYDKYNDINRWIPCSSDTAGLLARTYLQNEPWFSPAGYNRGQLKNVIRLAWNPNDRQRKVLYNTGINPIVSFAGEGTFLYGDKTQLTRPSAFSRINVRSLFIIIRLSIAESAKYQLFEFNDDITRSLFRNANNSYLESVQAKRGVEDFRVKCDEENNPPAVRQANEFVGSIFIKPNYSINFITLNFVAVGADVSFEEAENVQ